MLFFKIIHLLAILILAVACSISKYHQPIRNIAFSSEEKPSHIFRFYGKQEYLPKVMRIYERKFYSPVELNLETESPDAISCKGFIGSQSDVSESYKFTNSKLTIVLEKNISHVECTYTGSNQHADLKVTYELVKVPVILISPFAEQLKNEQQLLTNLNSKDWQSSLKEIIQQNKFSKIVGGSIPSSAELINIPEVEEGDWVEYLEAQGIIQYGVSQYNPEGTNSIPASDRPKLLFPNARPYALICGTKNNGSTVIMVEGKKSLISTSAGGTFFCAINVKSKSLIKTSGSFGVKLSHVSKKTVEQYLAGKIKQTQAQIAVWESQNQDKEEDNKEHLKLLGQVVKDLAAKDAINRYKEPPTYCSKELSGESSSYKDIKRLVLGDVGKFCTSPVELKPGQFLTICDGDAKNHYSGDFVIFDVNLKIISKTNLPATEERTTLSSVDRPLVRKDAAGKNMDFVLATKDGRILFYDLSGKLKNTIKIDYEYIESPILLPDGTMAFVASEDLMSDNQSLFYINDKEVLKKIDLPVGIGFIGPFLLNENVFLSGYDGQLMGFSKEREKIFHEFIEKDQRLSPPALLNESTLVIGTGTGKLFEIDFNTGKKNLLYRASYTGETSYSFSSTKMEPLVPNIQFTPVVLKDGRIVFATSGDGRVHMLTPTGQVEWQVQTPIVSGLLNFTTFPGTDFFLTGSISYMTIVRNDGHILARYSNSGAENPFTPLAIGKNKFLSGMYNGVFLFELKPTGTSTKTELKSPCGDK